MKAAAILNMPPPTDVHRVQRLCGMVQYLAKFMQNLASDLEPIKALTKKDIVGNWSRECEEALNAVKRKVTNTPVLACFNPEKELVLQVDSSKDGLGAAILQGGRPSLHRGRSPKRSRNGHKLRRRHCHWCLGLSVSTSIHMDGRYISRMTTHHWLPS